MSATRLMAGLLALLSPIVFTGCGRAVSAPAQAQSVRSAPEGSYAVGVRTIDLGLGTARPLPVTIWYPAAGRPAATSPSAIPVPGKPRRDAAVAVGRFPLVLFSHGLYSLPELHAQLTTRWAAAGFVVAAPKYPHTSRGTKSFSRADVDRQPADARLAIQQVLRLDSTAGDLFAGHLDANRLAAAGHSAGGYTTAGLFATGHSDRLKAGIIIAGAGMNGSPFAGPAAKLLFVHGGADRTVPRSRAVAAYDQVGWPKAFLTLPGQGHGEYLTPGRPGFDQTVRTTTDFLRWTLYDDAAAHRRLPTDASRPGVTELLDQL